VWDNDQNGVKQEISNHKLYVRPDEWKKMVEFPDAEKMRMDLLCVTDKTWSEFGFHYTKLFWKEKPNNLVGLRFKKHGPSGMCVNVGLSVKNTSKLAELEKKFAK
jgi:hypothetical protein